MAINTKKKFMAPTSLQGQTLGKYRILEPLGRGGMAQVYKAYHPTLDRYAAIKVLRSDLVEEEEFLSRFRREARSVASLRHPNIVQVFDFDVQDDLYYMVMELLEGDTLKAHLNSFRTRPPRPGSGQAQRLPAEDMVRILQDVLAGLGYAHSEGIIHRDLKPANIMLTARGQAVLTDFGIAQIVGGTHYTVSGALMGTLNYMAPEQGLEGKCDARSDIYSLGIAFYEMLTGRVPFDADTPLAILMKHVNDPLPLPRTVDPSIPELFERVVLKALAKQPADRFQSAEEMSAALEKAARQSGIEASTRIALSQLETGRALSEVEGIRSGKEAVAVFSGDSRQRITDQAFAAGDTAVTFNPAKTAKTQTSQKKSGRAALASVAMIIFANMAMLWASGIFGWDVFGRTWPMELVVAGILFFALMVESRNVWLLIPGGMVMGNGFILGYCALTGRWSDWAYIWPLEPLLVAGSIIAPFWIQKNKDGRRTFTKWFGTLVLIAAVALFVISMVVAILKSA
jgi:serine/threonine protein kinase